MSKLGYSEDDKRKHLEFIQLAINRMAANSFILKGWNITLVVGLFAVSITKNQNLFLILALLPAIAFWGLDSYYLRKEKLFRELYNFVRMRDKSLIDPYSLETKEFEKNIKSWFHILFSRTVIVLHGPIIIFILCFSMILWGG
ncbi:MAG: hypothetical protein JW716_03885 [Candidatus Aenigmarchaeota archaeon]|nr:hypothetical protein [Candidatus Aenigmarchaeota archaeon]